MALAVADLRDQRETQVFQVPQDHQAKRDSLDDQDRMAYRDQKVVTVCQEERDPKVATGRREIPVCLVSMELPDKTEHREDPDLPDPKESLDSLVCPAEACQDPKAEMDLQVKEEETVGRVTRERPEPEVSQETTSTESQDCPDLKDRREPREELAWTDYPA